MLAHPFPQVRDLDDLREFVHHTLCEQNQLEPHVFDVSERVLVRGQKPCGLFFCVHGPRSVKLTAIWETDRNTVLFYNSAGQRTLKTQLMQAPKLAPSLPH